jgi:hypothetical protein
MVARFTLERVLGHMMEAEQFSCGSGIDNSEGLYE